MVPETEDLAVEGTFDIKDAAGHRGPWSEWGDDYFTVANPIAIEVEMNRRLSLRPKFSGPR